MAGAPEDPDELFEKYINDNIDKLTEYTTVDINLLAKLVQEDVIKDHQKTAINSFSRINKEKADELYKILKQKFDDLPKIVKVFTKTGDKQAVKILEKFRNQYAPSQVSNPGSSQQAQEIRTDAVVLPAAPIPVQHVPAQVLPARIRGNDIRETESLKLAGPSGTSRDSRTSPLSRAHANVQNAIFTLQQTYSTGAKYKGLALIVNVINFDNEPEHNRLGAQKDTEELTEVLSQRNFLVYHLNDPTYQELQNAIVQFQDCTFDSADSFLLAVMSHGDGEKIVTRDSRRFEIWRRIVEQFNNTNCEGLKGKPKIFVFNYCRGDVTDTGAGSTQHDAMPERTSPLTIPSWTDMLVCYSTLDGHYAYRDVNEGSWFIQTLCEVVRQHGKTYDIMTLLNLVSEVMKSVQSEHGEKQICPYYNIGFTKKFYF
ncbi:unnamed protein product [Allacma fusca]|uniref:Uncharacterized protein n=1 Tax=Allacma fusca TaxID=39272 RepID=A0A8J2K8F5_9HEXA|nr:unnamed protein product [Allacma fusca]